MQILGGIRMLKFMAWERNFEQRVLKVRDRELKYQQLNYTIEVLWNAIWYAANKRLSLNCSDHSCNAQEWLAHPRHSGVVLALHSRSRPSAHPIHRIHLHQR